jgi:hypothetical protein
VDHRILIAWQQQGPEPEAQVRLDRQRDVAPGGLVGIRHHIDGRFLLADVAGGKVPEARIDLESG